MDVYRRFFTEGHLDDQAFLHHDMVEPQGLWGEAVPGSETQNTEVKDLRETGNGLRMSLTGVLAL